mmetsp:Transcript_21890/g.54200  ORF Transcript_21890/g.54200 Transcript_21890/m.54200 type:complete len:229 (-) Transcript_21890:296-982(-)
MVQFIFFFLIPFDFRVSHNRMFCVWLRFDFRCRCRPFRFVKCVCVYVCVCVCVDRSIPLWHPRNFFTDAILHRVLFFFTLLVRLGGFGPIDEIVPPGQSPGFRFCKLFVGWIISCPLELVIRISQYPKGLVIGQETLSNNLCLDHEFHLKILVEGPSISGFDGNHPNGCPVTVSAVCRTIIRRSAHIECPCRKSNLEDVHKEGWIAIGLEAQGNLEKIHVGVNASRLF